MSRKGRYLFTSESVTEGHPDKIADQISDSILDAILAQDPTARVACETLVTTGLALVAGEITTRCYVDFQKIVRDTIKDVGYTHSSFGFDAETCAVLSSIHGQSPDIAMGVDPGGAGDQGLMFGYACKETDELMPMPIMLAHKLGKGLSCARRDGLMDYLRPDGKSQVSIEYDNGVPVRVDTVVISTQHSAEVSNEQLRAEVGDAAFEAARAKASQHGLGALAVNEWRLAERATVFVAGHLELAESGPPRLTADRTLGRLWLQPGTHAELLALLTAESASARTGGYVFVGVAGLPIGLALFATSRWRRAHVRERNGAPASAG